MLIFKLWCYNKRRALAKGKLVFISCLFCSTFSNFLWPHLISPPHVWNFQSYFLHAVIFLALFPLLQKNTKKYFLSFKIHWKLIWKSFRANFYPCTTFSKFITVEKATGQRGHQGAHPGAGRPHRSADPGPTAPGPHLLVTP